MRIPKATFKKSGVIALLGVTSLLMTSVSPAAAVAAGAGAGTGWEYPTHANDETCDPPPTGFFAAKLASDRFEFSHTGTFDATSGTTAAAYVGDTDVSIRVGTHYISPLGTHSPGPGCPNVLPMPSNVEPGPVEIIDVTISGTAPLPVPNPGFQPNPLDPGFDPFPTMLVTGTVGCNLLRSEDPNNYQRVQSAVIFTFNVNCTIRGNVEGFTQTVQVDDMRMTIQGTMSPCLLAPPVDLVENPECQVIEDPENNDAGSHLVTTYDAVEPDPFPPFP